MIAAVIERCAGIDVGKKFLAVSVMTGPANTEARSEIRQFGTTVPDLLRLRIPPLPFPYWPHYGP